MKKKCLFLALLIILCCVPVRTNALQEKDHKKYLARVLFGSNYTSYQENESFLLLHKACTIALDQCNRHHENELKYLKVHKVRNLPSSIDVIDFSDNSDHRGKTHLGWDYEYPKDREGKDIANWPVRKTILRSTVNKVFNFGFFSGWFGKYDEKCTSFSALIYYVHVLGDTIADKENKKEHNIKKLKDLTLPLVVNQNSEVNPDIISEVKKHIGILFKEQNHSDLDNQLDRLRYNAKNSILSSYSEYNNSYYECAEELMNILIKNIPDLLQKESFFNKVFPSK